MGFSGTVASVLVSTIAFLTGHISSKQLNDYTQRQTSDSWLHLCADAYHLERINKHNNSL